MSWLVYIIECADKTLYTGITNDIEKRLQTHNEGQGAKYTRSRLPVKLVYHEKQESRGLATKREMMIKALSRAQKLKLIG